MRRAGAGNRPRSENAAAVIPGCVKSAWNFPRWVPRIRCAACELGAEVVARKRAPLCVRPRDPWGTLYATRYAGKMWVWVACGVGVQESERVR